MTKLAEKGKPLFRFIWGSFSGHAKLSGAGTAALSEKIAGADFLLNKNTEYAVSAGQNDQLKEEE